MKAFNLNPPCESKTLFSRDKLRGVPELPGCYALSNHQEEILYVGQATSLRGRMGDHLDSREKTAVTNLGAAFWFHYLVAESRQLNQIELGWSHQHENIEGRRPVLNKQSPPSP